MWCGTTFSHKHSGGLSQNMTKHKGHAAVLSISSILTELFLEKRIKRSRWLPKEFWNVMKMVPYVILHFNFHPSPRRVCRIDIYTQAAETE